MAKIEDIEDGKLDDEMEQTLNHLRRDRMEDLAVTAHLLASWMSDQKLTIAEQLATIELLRSSILVNYVQMVETNNIRRFMQKHPNAKVFMINHDKPSAPRRTDTINPNEN